MRSSLPANNYVENDAVVVVGGANSAGQAALALAEDRRKVHLVVRGDSLERSMARYLRDRIADNDLDVLFAHEVHLLAGTTHLEQVIVQNIGTGEQRTIDAGALLVLIGAAPRTDWLAGAIALDEEGYVLTGPVVARRPE